MPCGAHRPRMNVTGASCVQAGKMPIPPEDAVAAHGALLEIIILPSSTRVTSTLRDRVGAA